MDKKIEIEKIYILSSMQEGMLFHSLLQEDSQAYFEQMIFSIYGKLDIDIFEQSFNRIIERYDIFRTNFVYQKLKKAQQIVFKKREIKLYYEDISEFKDKEKYSFIEEFKFKDKKRGFNLSKEALIRIAIFKTSNEEYKLVWSYHHILMDGWCLGIVMKEILEIYKALSNKKDNALEKVQPYSNYIKWLKEQDAEEGLSYWRTYLQEYEQLVEIPKVKNRKNNSEYIRKEFNFELDKNVTEELNKLAIKNQVTMNTILQTTWGILLQKYNNVNDAVFGAVVSGRPAEVKGIERMVGLFINTIPVRIKGDKISFIELVKEVQEANIESEKYSYYPLYEIQANTTLKQELINNILVFENYPVEKEIENLNDKEEMAFRIKDIEIQEQTNYDFNTVIALSNNQIILKFLFNNNIYDESFVEKVGEHFANILKCILKDDKVIVKDIEILSIEEKAKILYQFNNTHSEYPRGKTVHELFEEQVEKTPDSIAIVFEDKELTYRELNQKSNRLARTLRKKGVKADSIVGIMIEKSIEMIVGIIAILKAGGAYLPIELDYPEDRIRYMLKDSNSKVLLIQNKFIEKSMDDLEVVRLDDENSYENNDKNLENITTAYNIAYVIYTSGSTGNPKGVMVEQQSVIRLVKNTNYISFKQNDKILQAGTLAFDASTFEIWGAMLNGLELHLGSKNMILNSESMQQYINKNNITILLLTTSLFNFMAEERPKMFINLRYLLAGGDVLQANYTNKVMEECRDLKIINGYGPTENTTFSTCFLIDKEYETNIPIGRPVSNSTAYIMDKHDKLQPIGICGELCVGGDGLARGYLNNPELTAERFVGNPYESSERMYRTGDLARWLPDGNIEFLGRIDHQVKIRGFRIELGEIESQLLNHESVKEAIVIDRTEKNGAKHLCAYLVSEKELTVGELRNYLSKSLPEYMIPSYFVQLEKMPLILNGKIDKKSLPEPDGSIVTGIKYEAPRNEVEEKLVAIWKDVLVAERVGINDNFFELGGHSLKAIVLVSKMHKELEVEIPIKEIFKAPTIKGVSDYIENATKTIYNAIEEVEEKEYYEVASAQKRMYMLQQFDFQSIGYNIPVILEVKGPLNLENLEVALKSLVKRHETLRTSFETIGDRIVQKINKELEINIEYIGSLHENFEGIDDRQWNEEKIDRLVNGFIRPFDLSKAPLLRVGVIRLSEENYILMLDMHHIISDGVSMGILIDEFVALYEGEELEALRIQYKDYSQWQNELLNSEVMKKQEAYWINKFSGEIPVLNMTTDYARPSIQSLAGDSISFKLDSQLTRELKKIAMETGSTMYMVLLSGINVLLSKYSGQEDIVVGSVIAGRPHADLQKIIGMFVNTLATRSYPKGVKIYKDFLKEIKESSLESYENQDYQFEEMIDRLDIARDISRNPLFDVMFTMQNMDTGELNLKDLTFKAYKQSSKVSKFDLTFTANEIGEEILINVEYSTRLYKKRTIETMVEHFSNILKAIAMNVNVCIDDIDMFSKEEKHKLLYGFNDNHTDYPRHKTISELFEQQAASTPNNIAVVLEEEKLTYRELNEKANALALTLREKGVKQNSIVGIMVDRSVDMIVGIMAILKAGGAYLPIDPSYPVDRIKYMLEDSSVEILLTQSKLVQSKLRDHGSEEKGSSSIQDNLISFIEFKGEVLDLENQNIYSSCIDNLQSINTPEDLIYVIYTSGSTGKPKGTKVMHYNVNRVVKNTNYVDITEEDAILQLSNYAFDGSVFDIYGSLLNGARLILIEKEKVLDIDKLGDIIIDKKVSVFFITTALFNTLVDNKLECFRYVRKVLFGGERISISHARKALEYMGPNKIVHVYGPTESTVFTTYYDINAINEKDENIPIGSPIANTNTYIIGKNNVLSAIGVPGEICISGEGLVEGYLNNQEITDEKFMSNPFIAGERMYRTGDLGRWLLDGSIEFLGRIDHQVKLRGFRIELGEIENELLAHEYIKESIVIDREYENGTKYLCAYLVSEKELTVGELREYLSRNLPEYMIPSYFVQLEKMPLTPNGKIDRKLLPEVDGSIVTGAEYEAARNEVEEKLVKIWSEVLGVEKIGINDNFFELGGHSLKATVLSSRMHKELDVEVPLKEIFKSPTIKGTSEYIESTEKSIYSSIEIVKSEEYYEASSAQKRMYLLQQFDLDSAGYNMPGVMIVEGRLEAERIERAFTLLIRRHETLRTSFETIEGKIVQRVNESVNFKLNCFEVELIESQEKAVEDIVKDFVKVFDLTKAPLLRVGLIKLEEDKHILMFDMHHIISDGVSMRILINEFVKIYEGNKLEQLRIQYKDYSQWQNKMLESEEMKNQKEYWIDRFSNEIPVLNMPIDFQRPLIQSFEGENISFKLDNELTKDLKRISKETGSTMYMVLLSGVNILLSKYSGQEDIIVGSPIAGRPHADLEKIIGIFVNTLAMRNYPDGNKTYEEFLKEVKENALKAYENQDYQFDELVDNLSIPRDISRNPLFDVMFTMQNIDTEEINLKELVFKGYKQEHKVAKFDLTFSASEMVENIILNLQYSTKLYKRETIERMVGHFVNILKAVATDTKTKLSEIEILTEGEKHKLLFEFNDTYADYPREKTIYELFEEQVEKTPDSIAVIYEDSSLTYMELNEKSNRLARTLREKGIKPDSIVGIMVDRSLEMIVGIMAILKSGGAYLPIDPQYPQDRIAYMLQDSETKILLTQEHLLNKIDFDGVKLNIQDENVYSDNVDNLGKTNTSKDLAYLIYTSGSTGNPKGVMIEHYSVINRLIWMQKRYPIGAHDIILQKTTYTFDVSVWELIWWSLVGAKVCLLPQGGEKDLELIAKTIELNEITVLHFVPSMLNIFLDYFEKDGNVERIRTLKQVFSSGEALSLNQVKKFNELFYKSHEIKLCNLYGPTEATVDVSFFDCSPLDNLQTVSIGKPIDNIELYILNKKMNIQPIGIPGELCIAGEGLARGYLNKPELTAEKFIESPFVAGERIYKTGDLARWMSDGNIEFLGRLDHQVKIRGFRIELGEIESCLLDYEQIKEVIVIDRDDEKGSKYLCAYVVSEKELTVGELRNYLSKNLPEHMIPSYFVQLDKMPLTPNGKIARKALPKPDGSIATGTEYEASRNEVEEKLAAIWSDVLGVEKIGINDNFFELGGHSLKATTLVSKIHKELNVEVELREIFKFPTIKGISEYIASTEKSIYSSIEIVEDKEYYEASSAQKRMYLLQQFDLDSVGYNMPGVMVVEGRLEAEKLEKSFAQLIRRHETLRTSFEAVDDKVIQRVSKNVNFKVECFEVESIESIDKEIDNIVKDFVKVFYLNKAPLIRVGLIKIQEDRHILMFDMHHIISDGVSIGILISEFVKIYEGNKLEQLRIQYKDYSQWQNKMLESEEMKNQKEYWIDRFSNEIPVLNMPIDFQRPLIQSFEGENISFKLDKELTKYLKGISKETGSTMYMILLSGVSILLSKYSGQEDIIVGSPIAGRPHADLERIIGMFVNTLAMRNHPDGNKTYEEFLKEVKENALKAYENQDYQFNELVDNLIISRDISRNPLFDVMFTMQNIDSEEIELKDLIFKGYKQEHKVAKFDLTFSASETVEDIILNLEYCTKLYKRETIERMIEHLVNILKAIATDTKIKINEIEILAEGEKHKLLFEFNDTYVDYPRDKTIQELFQEQVEKTPDNVAVVFEDKRLTYRELNDKANKLARILREKGVKSDSIVGIMVERSLEMIVGIMGILKAGGAYLPIDTEYPEERIAYMLEDSKTNIILTQSKFKENVAFSGEIIDLECEGTYAKNGQNIENVNTSRSLAYVIYTSGSTGKPKGVMIEHRSVINILTWFVDKYNVSHPKHMVNLTEYTFDPSVEQIFGSLIAGAKLYIPRKEEILDKNKFAKYVNSNKINVVNFIPAMIKELLVDNIRFDTVDTIIIGGERLEDSIKDKLVKLGYKVFNHYGPTETTIDVMSASCKEDRKVTLGKPIQNTEMYILDKENKVVPIGVCGELCISGEGLARGYLNRPELTLEKFIENPFDLEKKMYKTGDLARWLPDGNIEFLGRIDHQVKIRGFRIELGEIEGQLLDYEEIKEVIVLDREDQNGAKYLCAYLVSEKELTIGELRAYLSKKIPEYMIPSYFVQLDKMPLTPNGKVNRKALPEPDGSIITCAEYEVARNEVEEKLVAIWKDILAAERVGINDNFFELGGHSLKATTLVSKMHKDFNVEVPLREIFKFPTIKGISEYIKSTEKSIYSSIEIVEEKEYYEASSAQKRMYMLQQFDLEGTGYNMPGVLLIEGRLNEEKLEKSFIQLIRRHETLRTSFKTIEDKIVQRVNKSVNFKLDHFEVGCVESTDKDVDNIVKDFAKAFDLNKAPLLRVGLIKLEEEKHILMFDMHHIISDGVSMGILINEFSKIYEDNELGQLRIQYKDYSQWQNSLIKSDVMQEQKEYWINRFKGEMPVLNMPTDFQRPLMQSFEGESISFKLDKELTKNLKRISKETGSTMYMVLLSGVNILLSKYSGQEDIIVGSPIAGRPHANLLKIIGIFVNTLAMRNYPDGSRSYEDFLKEVKENALKAYENQDYQFDELVDKLSITRDISRNPLFDVMFTMQDLDLEEIELKNLVFKGYKQENKIAKFDLTFVASEVGEEVILKLEYCMKLYRKETIERMVERFVNILKAVVSDTKIKLSEIDMLTEGEKHKLLYEFNDTYADYPRDKTIQEMFEEQALKTPDNLAVVFEDKSLTYRELNEKANKLARTLRGKGVRPDSIVGIMVERSLEMIVGIIGVLKAGGAYLPIDPGYPEERIKYMVEDGRVEILLIKSKLNVKSIFKGELLDLEDEKCYGGIGENLDVVNSSRDLAYIIYTSGSTGKPKGVMIEHKNVLSLISALFNDIYSKYGPSLNIALVAPYVFDASVKQIFPAILLGHKLFIVPEETRTDGKSLLEYYSNNLIDISDGTPFHINMLVNARNKENTSLNVKCFIIGGDVFPCETVRKFSEKFGETKPNIVNIYGPTECCVDSIFYDIDMNKIKNLEIIPIGKPMCNELIYILGKNLEILPVGIVGEIYISGEGVGRGYLNSTELTAEKFIENPFIAGERMYKTGDLARWLPDGNVEFHGRIDHQVKVRGFRIELDEIESQLLNHESVKEVIVLGREDDNGAKYLCAYLVPEKELKVGELRNYLLKNLPEYMIPSYFVQVDKIPLTSNGKIDRKALPKPDGSIVTGAEYEAARNEVEERLVEIWKGVLALQRVGINDNFFELGGHSLKATTLVSKIHKELNVEVPLREIFRFPTIKGISEYIASKEESIYSSIEIVEEKEYYEASSAQKRMYMLQQFDLKSTGYNMPGVMLVEGRFEAERLERSFIELIRRHETLRTSFEIREDKILQRVNEGVNFKLNCFEVGCIESQERAVDNIVKDFVNAFNLDKAPLLRVGLIKLEEDKHVVMFDMHHIISDGVSMGILINEFAKIYEGNKLEQLRIQYKDYSEWQNSLLKSAEMEEQKEYWINRFSDQIPVLNIRTDFKRPLIQSFEGEDISFKLDKELTNDLKRISKETGSTMYMLLLSGVNILLSKYSGQEDIVVGSPIAGRPHADLEKIIGIFINTLAMRNQPEGNKTYENFLKEVKENALMAYENQDYQFDELVDNLSIPRDISRNALFDVMFTMQNVDSEEIKLKDLIFKGYKKECKVAKFDLTFSASEMGENIVLNIQYSTKLYKRETIKRMGEHFINILKAVTGDMKIKLSEIEMLTEGEKHKLLYKFNDTYADYPKDKTIHELFEEQALKTPNNIAISFEGKELTYRELNEKANKLARTLRGKGVKPDSIVGIMVERSIEMIVGIMGVLKAGGAYLPIEPEYPEDRKKYMFYDSKINILLTQSKIIGNVEFGGEIIGLEDEEVYLQNGENLENINTSSDLVYVIYTSGSTGKPKGVMIEQKGLVNYVFWAKKKYLKDNENTFPLYTSFSFDLTITSIFLPLISGSRIIVYCANNKNNMLIRDILDKNEVSTIKMTPAHLELIKDMDNKESVVRTLIIGGEDLKTRLVSEVYQSFNKNIDIYNEYGPTEAVVGCILYKYDYEKDVMKSVPIGNPADNVKVYILDKFLREVPQNVPGEMYISGDGLARGYLNRPELTAEKFIENPFICGERMYKTGDLAIWLPDGNIEFLGRIDHQVKIRGFRIELGEIECQLLNHQEIKEVIVLDREDQNSAKYLCAYLVAEKELTVGELRSYLSKKLPEYMIPSYFVQLDKMPLTQNGKINRKELPEPNGRIVTGTEYEAPRNEVEEKLVKIWSEVLGVDKVGINDNFFELGGHSLKATILVGKMYKEFNVEVPLKVIFKIPTIKDISKCILNKDVFTAYKDYSESEAVIKLNDTRTKNIFVFPPILGYGIVYNDFAKHIEHHTLYSFDFIEDKNRIKEYVRQITNIQKEGKYTLMGYSAGGNLAFEVAKELENRGYEVDHIILLDSGVRDKKTKGGTESLKVMKVMVEGVTEYVRINAPFMLEYISENVQRKLEKFALYLNELTNSGNVNANIHLILSSSENIDKETLNSKLNKANEWSDLTKKCFKVYQGYGEHGEMISNDSIKLNTQILNEILIQQD